MGLFQEAMKGFVSGFVSGALDNARVSHAGVAAVERLCRELGWSVDERVGDSGLILHFRDPIVNIRKVLVTCGESVVGISTFSAASVHASRVPQEVLAYLLVRNNDLTMAAWRVSGSDNGEASFILAYFALLAGLTANAFKGICEMQVKEAHAFDAKMRGAGLL